MMKMKLATAAAVAAGLLATAGANATTTHLGAAAVGVPLPFAGYVPAAGLFGDTFTFSLPTNGGTGYSVTNFTLIPGTFNTILNTLSLFSNPDNVLFNGDDTWLATSSVPGVNSIDLAFAATPAGNYYITVGGVANGTMGGIYNGAISVSAAPIPEPETYAMMLAGLAALGFLARRRQG